MSAPKVESMARPRGGPAGRDLTGPRADGTSSKVHRRVRHQKALSRPRAAGFGLETESGDRWHDRAYLS